MTEHNDDTTEFEQLADKYGEETATHIVAKRDELREIAESGGREIKFGDVEKAWDWNNLEISDAVRFDNERWEEPVTVHWFALPDENFGVLRCDSETEQYIEVVRDEHKATALDTTANQIADRYDLAEQVEIEVEDDEISERIADTMNNYDLEVSER